MTIRKIVAVFAAVLIVLGTSQLLFGGWWLDHLYSLLYWAGYGGLIGGLAVFFGGAVLIAAMRRLVGLRLFMQVLGLLTLAGGVVVLVNLGLVRDVVEALVFKRSGGFQFLVMWISGTARIVIGVLVVYALLARPKVDSAVGDEQGAPQRPVEQSSSENRI